jgi:phage shock protein C
MGNVKTGKVLVRERKGRMVAGICAGAAEYFGIDVTLIRVMVAVVCILTGGVGVLAYLVAWAIIPEAGE